MTQLSTIFDRGYIQEDGSIKIIVSIRPETYGTAVQLKQIELNKIKQKYKTMKQRNAK